MRLPPTSTLFPYTTLFRSLVVLSPQSMLTVKSAAVLAVLVSEKEPTVSVKEPCSPGVMVIGGAHAGLQSTLQVVWRALQGERLFFSKNLTMGRNVPGLG